MDGPWRESPTFRDCKEAALELKAAAWLGTGEAQGQVGSYPRARTGGATGETSTLPKHPVSLWLQDPVVKAFLAEGERLPRRVAGF